MDRKVQPIKFRIIEVFDYNLFVVKYDETGDNFGDVEIWVNNALFCKFNVVYSMCVSPFKWFAEDGLNEVNLEIKFVNYGKRSAVRFKVITNKIAVISGICKSLD